MSELQDDIAAYETLRADLETRALGKWAVVYQKKLVDTFEDFDTAAAEAVKRFGRGPYLIRQIGAPPITLPASVLYYPSHGNRSMRVR